MINLKRNKYSIFLLILLIVLAFKRISSNPISRNIKPQIIGGSETAKGEFPWVVSIRQKPLGIRGPLEDLCVGTIISPTKIATAAHCVLYFRPIDLLVVAGAWNLSAQEPSQQIVQVFSKWIHPEYDEDTSRNDIAILQVGQLTENEFVSPLRLPPVGHDSNGSCYIAGWGQTLTEEMTDIMMKGQIPIVSPPTCNEKYGDLYDPTTQLCAGREEGGVDACLYDTGGPLVCEDVGYKYFAGIVSWGSGCAEKNSPGVYTKVSYYVDMIPF